MLPGRLSFISDADPCRTPPPASFSDFAGRGQGADRQRGRFAIRSADRRKLVGTFPNSGGQVNLFGTRQLGYQLTGQGVQLGNMTHRLLQRAACDGLSHLIESFPDAAQT